MGQLRKTGKDVVIGVLITVLLFTGAEIFLRWKIHSERITVGQRLLNEAQQQQARGITSPVKKNPLLDEWEIEDAFVGYKPKSNFIYNGIPVTNSHGFRGPEFSIMKKPGVFRIVTMGDSVTFGTISDPLCNWPSQFQRQLDMFAANRYEVINGGVEGYGTWHVLQQLRYEIVPLNPDMIIVLVGWNDLWAYDPNNQKQVEDPTTLQKLKDHWFNRIVLKSYVMKWLTKKIFFVTRSNRGSHVDQLQRYNSFVPVASIGNYQRIVRVAKAAGIPWVVLGTQPSVAGSKNLKQYSKVMHFPTFVETPELFTALWDRYSIGIRHVAEEEGAVLIDLAEVIRNEVPDSGRYFFDSAHMYCEGYEILGRKVFEQLRRQGALPGKREG